MSKNTAVSSRFSPSPKDALIREIRRRVLTMELEPGASIDESSLGEEFGLSRTPVRDILRTLAGEGYVLLRDNRGAFVAPMTHKTLRSFFMTAPAVYANIATLACENARPEQIDQLREAQTKFRNASDAMDANAMATMNNQFHLIMGEMADNHYLLPSLQRLLIDHARIGQTFYRPRNTDMKKRMTTACDHHDQLIDTIERGDADQARAITFEHWELSRDLIEMFVRPDPLDFEIVSNT